MGAPDWTERLKPENGGPGESPGYQETLKRMRERGPRQKTKKKPNKKGTRRKS